MKFSSNLIIENNMERIVSTEFYPLYENNHLSTENKFSRRQILVYKLWWWGGNRGKGSLS